MQITNINSIQNSPNSSINKKVRNNNLPNKQLRNEPSFGLRLNASTLEDFFEPGLMGQLRNILGIQHKQKILNQVENRFPQIKKDLGVHWGALEDKATGFKSYFKNFTVRSISKAVDDISDTNLLKFIKDELPNVKIEGSDTEIMLNDTWFVREHFGDDITFIKDKLKKIDAYARKTGNKAEICPIDNKYTNVYNDGSPRKIMGLYINLHSGNSGISGYSDCGSLAKLIIPKK